MTSPNDLVTEFHEKYDCPIRTNPSLSVPEKALRISLITEEFEEFLDAIEADDIVGVADALGDMVYVIYGAALTFGIPLDDVLQEIQRSNLSKLGDDGKPVYGDGITKPKGKVLKGPNFSEPNLHEVLFRNN